MSSSTTDRGVEVATDGSVATTLHGAGEGNNCSTDVSFVGKAYLSVDSGNTRPPRADTPLVTRDTLSTV